MIPFTLLNVGGTIVLITVPNTPGNRIGLLIACVVLDREVLSFLLTVPQLLHDAGLPGDQPPRFHASGEERQWRDEEGHRLQRDLHRLGWGTFQLFSLKLRTPNLT